MKKIIFILALIATTATAQEISYGEYMQKVMEGNVALTARKLDIDIAEAQFKASKVFNDPTIGVTYSNNEDWDKGLGQGIEVELSKTFTFGVRKNRMQMADSERKLTVALFEEYMRNFRADATIAYLEHIKANMLLAETKEILNDLREIAGNDSLRYLRGEIAEYDCRSRNGVRCAPRACQDRQDKAAQVDSQRRGRGYPRHAYAASAIHKHLPYSRAYSRNERA